jgi:hypothetical protein
MLRKPRCLTHALTPKRAANIIRTCKIRSCGTDNRVGPLRVDGQAARVMVNTDKVKAARGGQGLKYGKKVEAIHDAARIKHDNEKRINGVHQQLRRFEDAGFGVATGKQHEHEENMRFYKGKLDAKKAKSKEFRKEMEAEANYYDGATSEASGLQLSDSTPTPVAELAAPPTPAPELRFDVGSRVLCRTGPADWAAGRVVQLHYREDCWPKGRVAPYQVALDDGDLIFAPADEEEIIRRYSGKAPMPKVPAAVPQQANQRIDATYYY